MMTCLCFCPYLEAALTLLIISIGSISTAIAFRTTLTHNWSLHSSPCSSAKVTLYSSATATDLWNANVNPSQPLEQQQEQAAWKSSVLPLPELLTDNPSMAEQAQQAMSTEFGPPNALKGRCTVNLDTFNNGRCKAQWLHVDPPVLIVDNFLTEQECNDILQITISPPPAGVGRVIKLESRLSDANKANYGETAVRRSTTWYVRYGAPQLAPLLRGLLQLLPEIRLEQTEEVQLVRYMGEGQGFGWHEDALSEEEATVEAGGQRIATVLVYLDECEDGCSGRTLFRDLRGKDNTRLGVSPKKGRALLFFPAMMTDREEDTEDVWNEDGAFGSVYYDNTRADHRTTHAGEPPADNGQKHIAQLWIHSGMHTPVVFGKGLNKHSEAIL